MNSYKDIEKKFLEFFKTNGHQIHDPAPIINPEDSVTMFNIAGMQQFVPFFLGIRTPENTRIATSQPCVRIGGKNCDLNIIGTTTRHTTLFKMLGNFSFGAYFKKESIELAWSFLESIGVEKKFLYVTVHPNDMETPEIWRKYVDKTRIIPLETNIWTMGTVGPFGYCTEIFYDVKERSNFTIKPNHIDEMLEIWNIVFMEFEKTSSGVKSLPIKCVDTGLGLERIASITERTFDSFQISAIKPIFDTIKQYNPDKDVCTIRMFTDHIRTSMKLIDNGLKPGNKDAQYVLRQLIRKCFQIQNINFILKGIGANDVHKSIIEDELNNFKQKIEETLPLINKVQNPTEKDIFFFKDTYGIPYEICEQIYKKEFNLSKLDEIASEKYHQSKYSLNINYNNTTEKLCYSLTECDSKIVHIEHKDDETFIILNKSCFYPNGGGQPGDQGIIQCNDYLLKVKNTLKHGYNDTIIHICEKNTNPKIGDEVHCAINKELRKSYTRAHSAAHLLGDLLEKWYDITVISASISQDAFRIDFQGSTIKNHISEIELKINQYIRDNLIVIKQYENIESTKAKKKEDCKYDKIVRTVNIGDISYQLCGGTHVDSTSEIYSIKILKDTSIGKGCRRLQCLCGTRVQDEQTNTNKQNQFTILDQIGSNIFQVIGDDKSIFLHFKKQKTPGALYFKTQDQYNTIIAYNNHLVDIVKPNSQLLGATKDNFIQTYKTSLTWEKLKLLLPNQEG